jgi:hypothetical protein
MKGMKKLAIFTAFVFLLVFPSACSEEEAVKPMVKVEKVDPTLVLEDDDLDLDLDLDLDVNPSFIIRKNQIKSELSEEVDTDVQDLIPVGKSMLATYGISPEQISTDPNDPMFAVAGMIIEQLEIMYANGYVLVEGPAPPDAPEALSGVGQCAVDAAGLGGFVHWAQGGVSAAGLNASVVLGTLGRVTVRGAIGWLGAAWVAYEFGKCLQKANEGYHLPSDRPPTEWEIRKEMERLRKRLQETKGAYLQVYGDTASYIHNETNPFMICPSCDE